MAIGLRHSHDISPRPLVQRHGGFYPRIRRNQHSHSSHHPTLSLQHVQDSARAQHMLNLRSLETIESGPQGDTTSR